MKNSLLKKCTVTVFTGSCLFFSSAHAQEKPEVVKRAKPAGGVLGMLLNKQKRGDMTKTMMNAKQLFLLMIEFDGDYGSFPNDGTAAIDKDLKAYTGKHSNDYLGQFLAGGYSKSEELFFAKGGAPTDKKPDNDISTQAKTLEAGECGFTYYKDLTIGDNAGKPLLLAPMTGKGFKFDPKPYNGKAVVLRIDGSVQTLIIDQNGDARLRNGKKLFEGGDGTVWGPDGPDVKKLLFPK